MFIDVNPKDLAAKTRVPLHLLPAAGRIHGAAACADGAKKYGPYNWRDKPISLMEYTAAMERHLLALRDGEDCAKDSGLHHLAHIVATASIVLDAMGCDTLIDDRPTVAGSGFRLLEELRPPLGRDGGRSDVGAAISALDQPCAYSCPVHGLSDTSTCCPRVFERDLRAAGLIGDD